MGTLLALDAPAPRLVAALAARDVAVSDAQAASALREEIAFYRAHHDRGRDAAGLAALRDDCAGVLHAALPATARELSRDAVRAALLEALRFRAYPEVPAALRALRAAGRRLVVVSNWDVSLHEALDATGLAPLVDGALSSAEAGVAKPNPAIFARALERAGGDGSAVCATGAGGLHAGDSVTCDVAGARAAGLRPVLVARHGTAAPVPAGVAVIRSLAELPRLAA
jgi:putative hydrolase of the HAD superfamily